MIGIGPVLNVCPWNNELYLIRYNNYDRAVINTVLYDAVHRWYAAHRTLTTELWRPENELWVKLKPGKALHVEKSHVESTEVEDVVSICFQIGGSIDQPQLRMTPEVMYAPIKAS
ncbi:trimethyllysine dioxygenase, mitochondrial-like [Melopsittacus undulatus]|uniref:trimethyllysine dioxygenase, mitochondrial-like n=1 Tax=Melopsittacus undulatus TaxID=13146 RepID=UPI00146E7AC1|nr:trimethyllysine dioxygenase, mitochondrial-like [Melopsittacus undulatus]